MSKPLTIALAISTSVLACAVTGIGVYAFTVQSNAGYPLYPQAAHQPALAPYAAQVTPQYPQNTAQPTAFAPTSQQMVAAPQKSALENPQQASEIRKTIDRLQGVYIPASGGGAFDSEKTATVFFDPRCPYCHAMYDKLVGKIPTRWIPVPVLGDNPDVQKQIASILAAENAKPGVGGNELMRSYFAGGQTQDVPIQQDLATWMQQNNEAFAAIAMGAKLETVGVPLVLVPKPDGTLGVHVGYSAGDEARVQSMLSAS